MAAKVTPAVNAAKAAGMAHRLMEYEYDPSADAIGLHAAVHPFRRCNFAQIAPVFMPTRLGQTGRLPRF
ncbi:hypothetical protein [Azospirillum argentinense]|uniref:hypothetical protein n=1 Tax=Azospirillum argentinense TaxID=2970906 RepID=UPI0020000328|nr:hypothetical protein [Azospirillum argentinense]